MAKPSAFYVFSAVLAVLFLLLVGFLGGLSLLRSTPSAETGGISAVGGGVSESVFTLFVGVVAVFLIVLVFMLRRVLRRR